MCFTADTPLSGAAIDSVRIFPLLPMPMFPSALYMLLNENENESQTHPALMSSFALLRFFSWAERVIHDASNEVGKTKKASIDGERRKTLVDVCWSHGRELAIDIEQS